MPPQSKTRFVWLICSIAALGGLLFGYDWVVIGGAKPFYERYFNLTSQNAIGWANSCALLGCLAGSIASGVLSDRWGRKKVLILSAFLFAVSSVLTGWAPTFTWFVVWRITGGAAIGMASNVSPMYIAEVSPAELRGRMVSLNQLTIVIGILVAQIANWLIARPVPEGATGEFIRQSWNGQYGWRWMFTAVAIPSVIFFVGACCIPESPRWLARSAEPKTGVTPWRALLVPRLRKVLGIGIVLAVLQQWSGINVIFNYAEEIYRDAGYDVNGILFNIVITGAINLVCTLIALGVVDRFGRRALMLTGCAGIAVSHGLLGLAYYFKLNGLPVLVLTLCTIGCYAMSLAPVTWVIISEIFPNRIRGLAVSVAVSALWVACFLLTFTFPLLNAALGPAGTFWLYAAICATGFFFILARVPETKGKTLEEIEASW
ncbi:MAG: sugar porter family MFS transporter [Candidatus Sulfopaludibacter sp.]|nr:sugar porter family MFS transporter [Candidatus Sulfopaludibacter sp.]